MVSLMVIRSSITPVVICVRTLQSAAIAKLSRPATRSNKRNLLFAVAWQNACGVNLNVVRPKRAAAALLVRLTVRWLGIEDYTYKGLAFSADCSPADGVNTLTYTVAT